MINLSAEFGIMKKKVEFQEQLKKVTEQVNIT